VWGSVRSASNRVSIQSWEPGSGGSGKACGGEERVALSVQYGDRTRWIRMSKSRMCRNKLIYNGTNKNRTSMRALGRQKQLNRIAKRRRFEATSCSAKNTNGAPQSPQLPVAFNEDKETKCKCTVIMKIVGRNVSKGLRTASKEGRECTNSSAPYPLASCAHGHSKGTFSVFEHAYRFFMVILFMIE